ncbi:MAG: NAD(P)H-hydrate dehydratase [Pseudomonadota bacterium]
MSASQVLTALQMRAAEQELFDTGLSESDLMEVAGTGAAEWVRRLAGGRSVTVLCGPGNNGGDGYVIARRLREWGLSVQVVAALAPKTDAAINARDAWGGSVFSSGGAAKGDVLVDCLFGSGLARPLSAEHTLLLRDLADRHSIRIAIDLPSGVATDTGEPLNEKLPHFTATLALGAWKYAHALTPARAVMGAKRLVPIGIKSVADAAHRVEKPRLKPPHANAHKYTRGMCAIVAGEMPGAATLAAIAAQWAGAGYTKRLGPLDANAPAGLVCDERSLAEALSDKRLQTALIGPGLGRGEKARASLTTALRSRIPLVLDADVLHLLSPSDLSGEVPIIATPHDGELDALCRRFAVIAEGRLAKAKALAKTSGMVILAKGPDSFVASPDGAVAVGPGSSPWLSTAGTGDVLAGILVSRLAVGSAPFDAACEALWLHKEAARISGPAFTADDLARSVKSALARGLAST